MIAKLPEEAAKAIRAQQYINSSYLIVKELVENALDASATEIKVQFGDIVCVDDNGCGIDDLESICKNGYTSKASNTYRVLGIERNAEECADGSLFVHGFRGQALSSIKELCDIEISTRTASSTCNYGQTMNYTTGVLKRIPREQGTTVKISNIFKSCPVRKMKDGKQKKKTLLNIISLFQSFCHVYNVHFTLISHGKVLFSERGSSDTKAYAIKKYGSTFLEITDLLFDFLLFPLSSERKQHIFLNKQVVVSPRLTTIITVLFKKYLEASPTFVLVLRDEADINVSVDKSSIFLKNCVRISNRIKEGIDEYFSKQMFMQSTLRMSESTVVASTPEAASVTSNDTLIVPESISENDQEPNNHSPVDRLTEYSAVSDPLDSSYTAMVKLADIITRKGPSSQNVNVSHSQSLNTLQLQLSQTSCLNSSFIEVLQADAPDILMKKEYFALMSVIGQFNNGFILSVMEIPEGKFLIVVDQHAADEIYNFETLRKTFVLKKQKLLVPVQLNLSPTQELLMEVHMSTFEHNGFEVKNKQLLTIPVYKNHFFTVEDFYSLLENLSNEIYESERFRNIMASKACRSSVMIGSALNHKQMKEILDHLAMIERPWKCPHGRPTSRVLMKLG